MCMLGVQASTARAQQLDVSGIVRDSATSQALSGAIVQLTAGSRTFVVRSDDAGEFFVSRVQAGDYAVTVRRIGYIQYSGTGKLDADHRQIAIRLTPVPRTLERVLVHGEGTGIYGEVASLADLKPVAHARVQVAGSRQEMLTDSLGAFFVALKSPGTYVVRITAPGYAPEFFTVPVKRNSVSDASRLLTSDGQRSSIPEGLWEDLDQRLSWRSPNHSVLVSGADVRRAGASLRDAVQFLGPVVAKGFRLGSGVCVYVDGTPRPGYPLNGIRPEEVKAMEVYGRDREIASYLKAMWPGKAPCSETGTVAPRRTDTVTYIVIWTK